MHAPTKKLYLATSAICHHTHFQKLQHQLTSMYLSKGNAAFLQKLAAISLSFLLPVGLHHFYYPSAGRFM